MGSAEYETFLIVYRMPMNPAWVLFAKGDGVDYRGEAKFKYLDELQAKKQILIQTCNFKQACSQWLCYKECVPEENSLEANWHCRKTRTILYGIVQTKKTLVCCSWDEEPDCYFIHSEREHLQLQALPCCPFCGNSDFYITKSTREVIFKWGTKKQRSKPVEYWHFGYRSHENNQFYDNGDIFVYDCYTTGTDLNSDDCSDVLRVLPFSELRAEDFEYYKKKIQGTKAYFDDIATEMREYYQSDEAKRFLRIKNS